MNNSRSVRGDGIPLPGMLCVLALAASPTAAPGGTGIEIKPGEPHPCEQAGPASGRVGPM